MTATLHDVNSSKKKSEPSSEETAAAELELTKEQGLSLTGPDGPLKQFTKNVLETALNEEMTEHLGYEKNLAEPERQGANILRRRHEWISRQSVWRMFIVK